MSLSIQDHTDLAEGLDLDYGVTLESVSFLDRLNYLSPYARLNYAMGQAGAVQFGYSSGVAPPLNPGAGETGDADLQRDLMSLALFPRVSLEEGRVRVQRNENFETGLHESGRQPHLQRRRLSRVGGPRRAAHLRAGRAVRRFRRSVAGPVLQ